MLRQSPHQRLSMPVFWVNNTAQVRVGYSNSAGLLGWVSGVIRSFLSLFFGSGGGSVDQPPGISESDTPGNSDPPPVPVETEEVDWSDVNVIALASSSVPRIGRLLIGPAQRALADLSKGRATLHIVAERTHPKRFARVEDIASVEADPVYIFILIDKQDSGLVKGIITKKIETKVLSKLGNVKAPFELIFRRTNRTLYDQIISALETPEAEPERFERSDNSSILRDLGILKSTQDRIEKSDSKILKSLVTLNKIKGYDLEERGFPFKKIILALLLGFGVTQLIMWKKNG